MDADRRRMLRISFEENGNDVISNINTSILACNYTRLCNNYEILDVQ